jgi:protein gp37
MLDRLIANPKTSPEARAAYRGETGPVLFPDRLAQPARRKKPSIIGVQFMGDLFHEDVPWGYIEQVFGAIMRAPQHLFVVLTKRAVEMREDVLHIEHVLGIPFAEAFPNVIGMVTAERQFDKRLSVLLNTPLALRGLSLEPLLGRVDLAWVFATEPNRPDWVIVGGESGPGARPMHPNWAREVRDDCAMLGIPFFFKQWGEWLDVDLAIESGYVDTYTDSYRLVYHDGHRKPYVRVGKKRAGRLLDGREWKQYPRGWEASDVK